MKDIDLHRHWKNGKNTFEISRLTGLKEHEVSARLYKLREDIRKHERQRQERDAMYARYLGDLSKKKGGFTGLEIVAGTRGDA